MDHGRQLEDAEGEAGAPSPLRARTKGPEAEGAPGGGPVASPTPPACSGRRGAGLGRRTVDQSPLRAPAPAG